MSPCHFPPRAGQSRTGSAYIPSKYSAYRITTAEGIPPGGRGGRRIQNKGAATCRALKRQPLQCGTAKSAWLQVAGCSCKTCRRVVRVREVMSPRGRTVIHPPTHQPSVRLGDTPPHSAPPHVTSYHGHVWHLLAYLQKCSEAVVLEPLPDRTSRPLHTGSFPAQLVPSSQTGRLIIPSFPSLADTWCNATPC